jgi:tetratricopeptide (TPR) repeat protein
MSRALLLVWLTAYAAMGQVRVWESSLQLPTYAEGEPDPIPELVALTTDEHANYPYPNRSQVSAAAKDRSMVAWRTLNLENEYLFCRILPDLGGHIYNCRDKLNDREMFYMDPAINKALIGLRGAGISTGVEPNFPATHNRASVSPLNFAMRSEAGGAASVIVSDTDRVTGMQWRVEYRLQPASAMFEQRMTFYNPTPVRKPYLWWNNAAIAWDDPGIRYIFPTNLVVSHGGTTIEAWPVSSTGVDISAVDQDRSEAAWFAYQCHEPFMGIYKPKFRSGVAHYADATVVTGKKLWIMGLDQVDSYRGRLNDGGNVYVEMQAGAFQDQETYEFLGPEQSRAFTEYWIPFRGMSGLTRATPDLVLYAARAAAGTRGISIELSATRAIAGAKIRILSGASLVLETAADLDPAKVWKGSAEVSPPFTIQVLDAQGHTLLGHREGTYNAASSAGIKIGPQKPIDWDSNVTEGLLLKRGDHNEQLSQTPLAQSDYALGLQRFPQNREFDKAAGRLALSLGKFEDAAVQLKRALAAPTLDYETLYYVGAGESLNGREQEAVKLLSQVSASSEFSAAASLELAFIAARAGDYARSLKLMESLQADPGRYTRIAGIRAALLRRMGNKEAALNEVKRGLKLAPEDALLRYEGTLAGIDDPALWSYLAGDAERVLNIADEYMRLALWEDALACLAHDYTHSNSHFHEPGAVPPENSALAAYYLAFCQMELKKDPTAELGRASLLGTRYQFPSRLSSYAVLRAVLRQNPSDATAHALLGNLDAFSLRLDEAAVEWGKAVALNPKLEIERQDLTRVVAVLARKTSPPSAPRSDAVVAASGPAAAPAAKLPALPPKADRVTPRSAVELAADAMITAASGRAQDARETFRGPAFAAEKQPPLVRQAYIEVQLQILLGLSAGKKCEGIDDRVETLGLEDKDIPFTLYGFGQFMRVPHFQYYLGVIEANCGLTKQAHKYWAKIAKLKESPTSPEFAYPLLAASRLDAGAAKASIAEAAKAVPAAGAPAGDPVLTLNRALALRAGGDEATAMLQLAKIARESADPVVRYLATIELGLSVP